VHPVTYGEEAWELEESFERDYIKLAPSPRFGSASMAGWEPPEGFSYDVQLLYLELEPVTVAELPTVVLSADELDQFVGTYEVEPGVILEIWREGDALMAAPQDDKTRVVTLTAYSATEFWTDAAGSRRTFVFNFGSDGAVEALTMAQSGRSMTFPRVP
jgi:hypothetical protein